MKLCFIKTEFPFSSINLHNLYDILVRCGYKWKFILSPIYFTRRIIITLCMNLLWERETCSQVRLPLSCRLEQEHSDSESKQNGTVQKNKPNRNSRGTLKQSGSKPHGLGDATDDVHICILCLRAIMNHQVGLPQSDGFKNCLKTILLL